MQITKDRLVEIIREEIEFKEKIHEYTYKQHPMDIDGSSATNFDDLVHSSEYTFSATNAERKKFLSAFAKNIAFERDAGRMSQYEYEKQYAKARRELAAVNSPDFEKSSQHLARYAAMQKYSLDLRRKDIQKRKADAKARIAKAQQRKDKAGMKKNMPGGPPSGPTPPQPTPPQKSDSDRLKMALVQFKRFRKRYPKATYELSKMMQKHGREKIDSYFDSPEGIVKITKAIKKRLKAGGERVRIGKDGKPVVMSPKRKRRASGSGGLSKEIRAELKKQGIKYDATGPLTRPNLPRNWRTLDPSDIRRQAFRAWYTTRGPGKGRRRS